MNSKKFSLTKRKFYKRNFSDVIQLLIPGQYLQSDIDYDGTEVDPFYNLINSHISIIDDIDTIRPLSPGTVFSSLDTYYGIAPFFIKQNRYTDIPAEEFERHILNPVGKTFKDFENEEEFRDFLTTELIPTIQTNNPQGVFSGASGIDELVYRLGWFYFLAGSSTYDYQPSSTVVNYFVDYTFKGKPLEISDGINALTEFIWYNQKDLAEYIPPDFLSGTTTYTSGTQGLEKLKTLNKVVYAQTHNEHADTLVRDAIDLFAQTSELYEDQVSKGPFYRLLKAYSFAFADQQNEVNELSVLYDLQECPDYLLPELAKLIGWELLGYDPTKWRLQLANAVQIYKRAGTKQSILAAVNSVFTPGVVDLSGNIQELWESYIPFLIMYSLATESIHFQNFRTWTPAKAQQLGIEEYDYRNFDNNIRLAVDKILLTLFEEYPDHFILGNKLFPVDSEDFVFNYRQRTYPIPPFEEIPYYTNCLISFQFLLRLADLLVCYGVPQSFALKVRDYIQANTTSIIDDKFNDFTENNGWLFFTTEYQEPPNWDNIIIDPQNKKENYLSMWSGKSSHYKLNFDSDSFDFSKNTYEVDSSKVVYLANRIADTFSPAKAVKDANLFLRNVDYYTNRSDNYNIDFKLDYSEELVGQLTDITLGNKEISAIDLIGAATEFSGGRYSFSSIIGTPLSSVAAEIKPRNTYRRRGLHNKLNVNGYYNRTGFNPPTSPTQKFYGSYFTADGAEFSFSENADSYQTLNYNYTYNPCALLNPVKGYFPTYGSSEQTLDNLPHSVQRIYIGMSDFYANDGATNSYDYEKFEEYLDEILQKNCQALIRIFIDHPKQIFPAGHPNAGQFVRPESYAFEGFKMPSFLRSNVASYPYYVPAGPAGSNNFDLSGEVPDYGSNLLLSAVSSLVVDLGNNYDGDIRIAHIQVGICGHWGEWHNWLAFNNSVLPKAGITQFPPVSFIDKVIETFEDSFSITKLSGRYYDLFADRNATNFPNTPTRMALPNSKLGEHDDSFCWHTIGNPIYFADTLRTRFGLQDRWRVNMHTPEIRPELLSPNLDVFNNSYQNTYNPPPEQGISPQNLFACLDATHPTLISNGAFYVLNNYTPTQDQLNNIINSIYKMGYSYDIESATIPLRWNHNNSFTVDVRIQNRGVAPFYYDWPMVLTLSGFTGNTLRVVTDWDIKSIIPGTHTLSYTIEGSDLVAAFPSSETVLVSLSIEKPSYLLRDIEFMNFEHRQGTPYMSLGVMQVYDSVIRTISFGGLEVSGQQTLKGIIATTTILTGLETVGATIPKVTLDVEGAAYLDDLVVSGQTELAAELRGTIRFNSLEIVGATNPNSIITAYATRPRDPVNANENFFFLGFIPSALKFQGVSADCSGIIQDLPNIYADRCAAYSTDQYYGYDASNTIKLRGFKDLEDDDIFLDREQLDPFMAVVHKVATQKVYKKYEKYVHDNIQQFAADMLWKDVIGSMANEEIYCSGLFLSSIEAYENFGLGRKVHELFDLYATVFNRHPTTLALKTDFGSKIYAHAYGNILDNGDFEIKGNIARTYDLYTSSVENVKLLNRESIAFSGSEANLAGYQTKVETDPSAVIARSTSLSSTVELVNSSIVQGVELVHTSGTSLRNQFIAYDLQTPDAQSFVYNNAFLRLKAIDGLPRIRYRIKGSDFSDQADTYRADNFLCPEHEFHLKIRALAAREDGTGLNASRLGVWIHTATEGTNLTWHFNNKGRWELIDPADLTIRKIIDDLTFIHTFREDDRSVERPIFQCLDSDELFPALTFLKGIGTFEPEDFQEITVKFNTRNYCRINTPEVYYKHHQKVHRHDQTYVIEVFMIPEPNGENNFVLIDDISLRDDTIYDLTRIDVTGTPTGHKKFPLCDIYHIDLTKQDIRAILNYYNQLAGKGIYVGGMSKYAVESSAVNDTSGGSRLDFRINPNNLTNAKDVATGNFTLIEV